MEVSYRSFDFADDIKDVVAWHKDHVAINFPDSKYKPELFKLKVELALSHPTANVDKMWTAWVKDEKIGWLWVAKKHDVYKELDYCEVRYIHLVEGNRGQGFGSQLLDKAEEQAKKWKCEEMRLGTAFDNRQAINFYVSYGYMVERVLMEKKL